LPLHAWRRAVPGVKVLPRDLPSLPVEWHLGPERRVQCVIEPAQVLEAPCAEPAIGPRLEKDRLAQVNESHFLEVGAEGDPLRLRARAIDPRGQGKLARAARETVEMLGDSVSAARIKRSQA